MKRTMDQQLAVDNFVSELDSELAKMSKSLLECIKKDKKTQEAIGALGTLELVKTMIQKLRKNA